MNFGSSGPVEILFALVRVMLAVYLRNISSHRLGVVGWFFFFFCLAFSSFFVSRRPRWPFLINSTRPATSTVGTENHQLSYYLLVVLHNPTNDECGVLGGTLEPIATLPTA